MVVSYKKFFTLFFLSLVFILSACSEENTSKEKKEEETANSEVKQEVEETSNKEEAKVSLPDNFFLDNRKKLAEKMEVGSVVVLYGERIREPYFTEDIGADRNFYYLTGVKDSEGFIVLKKNKDSLEETLYLSREAEVNSEEAEQISKISTMKEAEIFEEDLNIILSESPTLYLELNGNKLGEPVQTQTVKNLKSTASEKGSQVKDISETLASLRMVKTEEEINMIKEAIAVTIEGIKTVMKTAKDNINEAELEEAFINTLHEREIDKMSFGPIIGGGKNSTEFHYQNNNMEIPKDSMIVNDVGAEYEYYAADITRSFPVDGTFTDRQKEIYELVLKAQEETINAVKPGVTVFDLERIATNTLSAGLLKLELISDEGQLFDYYPHVVTHHLGLEAHDTYNMLQPLEPGMVITVEPGIYIPEEKLGVRIEDDILVTENGNEVLSKDLFKSIEEIESFMKE
ncbi:aminopeptidase P N-terminal domain-containing protein [Bacillus spongiae]|uniref:Xaa-Pro aminopeptidase n=1 Tax=Bacillus spongiae TaxID=2683610 RepID=A0ABU8HFB4_9BACI